MFLNYLLQNPTVKDKKLSYEIASPFNLVLELASYPKWGGIWEEIRTGLMKRFLGFQ